jgi:hypothetical protein
VTYDDTLRHYGRNFPEGLPADHGATHIGMFLGWAILRDLIGDRHREEETAFDLERVRNRQLYPRDFFLNWCDDEKLTDADLNSEGNAFARAYYEEYFDDWAALFPETYRIDDSWENFDRLVALLDRRFAAWRNGRWEARAVAQMSARGAVLSYR